MGLPHPPGRAAGPLALPVRLFAALRTDRDRASPAGRYFGLRSYGKINGIMFGLFLIGGGVGPYLSGLAFDLLHSYEPALLAFIAALLGVSLLFVSLGT